MKVFTLTKEISCEGVGLHSGSPSRVVFRPSKKRGIFFKSGGSEIAAEPGNVTDTTRGVSLGAEGQTVKTVEHLLAALLWLGLRDVEIEIQGEEIPALDGSALPWIQLLKPNIVESADEFPTFKIREPLQILEGEASAKVFPADDFAVSYTIDFPNTPVGLQTWQGTVTSEVFERELAPARTFGFLEEVKSLWNQGLGQGGNLENCVVIAQDTFLTPLRFSDEMVRHKVMDLMGDLALIASIPKARLEIRKGSHRLHVAMAKAIKRCWGQST